MNKLLSGFILLSIGLVTGYFIQPLIHKHLQSTGLINSMDEAGEQRSSSSGEKEILYWVAPMDANYRRDKPGKSPMGMDLVPVYKEDAGGEEGVVKISPVVQNNLGVRMTRVKKAELDREINTVGYITFDEEKLFHLHTRVDGWVEKLVVKATGDVVKQGQKLFELYSPALVNAQEEYITALKSNNRMLIKASKDRLLSLGVSANQIQKLEKTRKIQQRIAYYAKYNGFIEKMSIREGMFVKPAMEVLSIGQIDTVWVIAEVFERQSGWVKPGQSVDMVVEAFPGKTWDGIVDYIYPVLDEKTRTLRVQIRFDNSDQALKPNMFSRLTIRSRFDPDTLFVKREAIIRNGKMDRVVKSLGDGKFKSLAIKTGSETGDYIEVIKGLKENDEIVTSAQFLIDSESSLSASFERMEEPLASEPVASQHQNNQAWIDGKVVDIMPDHNMLTIQHNEVPAWGWPEMLMDFPVSETIDVKDMQKQQNIRFLVEKHTDGSIELIEIEGFDTTKKRAMPENKTWIRGTVKAVIIEHQKLTVQHGPVAAWGWPEMEMDFPVIQSMDLSSLKAGDEFDFLVEKHQDGSIEIIEMSSLSKEEEL